MTAAAWVLPWVRILLGALLLLAATPPAWAVWTPILVVPGLAVQFAVATGTRRPLLASYLLGALHIGAFSWSLRHVAYGGWLAIALLGGLYHVAAAVATRRWPRAPALAFAVAVAGVAWLRAEMPGIAYPHGQPCHDLAPWPLLLGAVRLGGEPLANALLAALAATAVQCWRGWRGGVPTFRAAVRRLCGVLVLAGLVTFFGASPPRSDAVPTVAIAAIEWGVHPVDAFADLPRERRAYQRRLRQLIADRLIAPTEAAAATGATANPPDLVLWPESSVPYAVEQDRDGALQFEGLRGAFALWPATRVCLGSELVRADGRSTPAAVLVDAAGAFIAHQEKQRLVPAGETLPGIEWLPSGLAARLRQWLQTNVGVPVCLPGRALPPLLLPATATRPEVPFAALVCYDNAYPDVVAGAVADGARFVAVLSNEAWFRGGGELDQLVAIAVLRAVAAQTPMVRCTTDGWSMAVDRDGRILASLPPRPTGAAADRVRVLRVDLPLGDGRLPPMARLHPWLGWGAAAAVVLLGLHAAWAWARLLRLGQATVVVGGGSPPEARTGGS